MMKRHLIRTADGEQQLVASLDGYEGCEVLESDVPEPPHPFAVRRNGKWADPPGHARQQRRSVIRAMDPVDRFEELEARLAEVEAELAELRAAQNGG